MARKRKEEEGGKRKGDGMETGKAKKKILTILAPAPNPPRYLLNHIAACLQSSLCATELLTLGNETKVESDWMRGSWYSDVARWPG